MADPDYLRAALRNPYHLVVVSAVGLLGLLNWNLLPLLLPVAGALEGIYLLTVPGARWFRRWVNLEEGIKAKAARERARSQVVKELGGRDRAVYEELLLLKQGIVSHCEQHGETAQLVLPALGRLDELIQAYLQMGLIRVECERHLDETDIRGIEADLKRLRAELPTAPPKAQASKQQNIEILEKRLERLTQIREYVEVIASQQKGINDAFHLLNDQILTLGFTAEEEAGLISTEIDRLLAGVGGTEEAIKKISIDMTAVQKVLGELSSTVPAG